MPSACLAQARLLEVPSPAIPRTTIALRPNLPTRLPPRVIRPLTQWWCPGMIQKSPNHMPSAQLPEGGGPRAKSTGTAQELVRDAALQDAPGALSPQQSPGIGEALRNSLVHTQV